MNKVKIPYATIILFVLITSSCLYVKIDSLKEVENGALQLPVAGFNPGDINFVIPIVKGWIRTYVHSPLGWWDDDVLKMAKTEEIKSGTISWSDFKGEVYSCKYDARQCITANHQTTFKEGPCVNMCYLLPLYNTDYSKAKYIIGIDTRYLLNQQIVLSSCVSLYSTRGVLIKRFNNKALNEMGVRIERFETGYLKPVKSFTFTSDFVLSANMELLRIKGGARITFMD